MFSFLKSGFERIKKALAKARSLLGDKIRELFKGKIDESTIESLEQVLYEADLGVKTASELTDEIREYYKSSPSLTAEQLIRRLKTSLLTIIGNTVPALAQASSGPTVILIVGVNGNGKTTTIAKLAKRLKESGKSVLLAAGDTYRAAGVDQLALWGEKLGIDVIRGKQGGDAAAVAFDAITAATARGFDIVIIDTAGRLHTKTDLMQELGKMRRACNKTIQQAPHETLLVLDATTGQNAIDQATVFQEHTPLDGIVLTKLDGTAKGGIVIALSRSLGVPVKFIGVGEGADDLEPFIPEQFIDALFD